MKEIILKSNKDHARYGSRPTLDDILSPSGFIRYFLYRNGLPAFRDIVFFLLDTGQIFLISLLLGRHASSAGIVGYVSTFLLSGFLNIFVYSMREKILELEHTKRLNLLPHFFIPTLVIGLVLWVIVSLSVVGVAGAGYQTAIIILVAKLITSAFDFFSTLYFFSTYTLSRVYIPLSYTLINRIFHFLLPVFLVRYIGVYAFALAFISERIFNVLITVTSCNRILRSLGVKLVEKVSLRLIVKKLFWFLYERPSFALKRSASMLLMNLQRFLVIILVKKLMPFYMLEFFAFYQMIHLFMLAPLRISKAMFYDITTLLYKKRFGMLGLLFNCNIIATFVVAVLSVIGFYFLQKVPLPQGLYAMMAEILVLDKWGSIYTLVFCYPIILVFSRLFLVAEAHIIFILTTLIFDFILLGYLLFSGDATFISDSPLMFFSIQGILSPFYLFTLFVIYATGVWKKESFIAKIKQAVSKGTTICSKAYFIKMVKEQGRDNSFFVLALFNRSSARYMSDLSDTFSNAKAAVRLSSNALLLLFNSTELSCTEGFKLGFISSMGIYCDKIIFLKGKDLYKELIQNFSGAKIDDSNAMLNALYPTFSSYSNDAVLLDAKDIATSLQALLDKNKLKYRFFDRGLLPYNLEKNVFYLFSRTDGVASFVLPERILLKRDFLGLIPIVIDDKVTKVVKIYLPQLAVVRKVLRSVALTELSVFLGRVSKG